VVPAGALEGRNALETEDGQKLYLANLFDGYRKAW
jgi:hypothetical protein